jgi:dynein light chain 4
MAAATSLVPVAENKDAFIKMASYPLIKHTDMESEMRTEAMEICTSAVEKYPLNQEKSSQLVKELMDKKFGAPWNVVIGEYFAFEVTTEVKHLLYMFCGGTNAVLVWKSQ